MTNMNDDDANTRPTISAIVATMDRPQLLRAAIRSMIDQVPVPPDEIIVVYDQRDPEPGLADEFPDGMVKVITNHRTPGLPGARNSGIEAATGDWVAFCDDDDEWTPDRLASQVSRLRDDVDFVVGGITIIHGDRSFDRTPGSDNITFNQLLRSRVMGAHSSTFLIRRSAILTDLGWDDETLPGKGYGEDYDWMLRAARMAPIASVDRPLAIVGWQPNSSYYRNRWQTVVDGTQALIDRTPEFHDTRAGMARMTGHMAFAYAGLGETRKALRMVGRTFVLDPRQLRTYITLAVLTRIVRPEWLVRKANALGRGI